MIGCAMRLDARRQRGARSSRADVVLLLQIAVNEIDELLCGLRPVGVACERRIDDVKANVVLENLGHEAVDRSACGGERLQNGAAIAFCFEEFFDAIELPADSLDAVEQLGAFANSVSQWRAPGVHGLIYYTPVGYCPAPCTVQ